MMKIRLISIVLAAVGWGVCPAAEPVSHPPIEVGTLKTRDGRIYEKAKVLSEDAVGLKIIHEGGTARIAYERLPDEWVARFNHDPEAAKAQLQREAAEREANEKAIALAGIGKKGMAGDGTAAKPGSQTADENNAVEDDAPIPAVEELPKAAVQNAAERVVSLRQYVARLKAGIAAAEEQEVRLLERASRMASGAVSKTQNARGQSVIDTNPARIARAEGIRDRAMRGREKIVEAKALIDRAEAEISSLQAGR